ncbi:1-alkyl-2-acetylglycerophosphocholine esterase [Pleurostoma richardsiae]|uniref:1-alkyl-2-acetylglycerophosphocholine esterase n=1 Tax=Pleurostoma richardsiae TaxID=41990 RepID=A0AA38S9Y3_9PEZI|nr:1-alkyl-2-acetylglycerophosphocholine esterase [Pleurostoma richardsiae]
MSDPPDDPSPAEKSRFPGVTPGPDMWAEAIQKLTKEDRDRLKILDDMSRDPHAVVCDVLAATNEKKDDCLRKRWSIVLKGQTIILRDVFEKIAVWVNKFMAIGDLAVQYDPVAAALPWAAVRLIMQASVNDVEAFGQVIMSLESVTKVITQCRIVELLYRGKRNLKVWGQLSSAIISLYANILEYLVGIFRYYRAGTTLRFIKSAIFSKSDVQDKFVPIASARDEVQWLVQVAEGEKSDLVLGKLAQIDREQAGKDQEDQARHDSLRRMLKDLDQPISRISSQLAELHDDLQRDTRAQVLRAISTIPYGAHHKVASKGRLAGSGQWLLSKPAYRQWRRSSSSSVLWLHGIPGSGKTKLTSLVVDELRGHEHIAYFYCIRDPAEPQRAQCDKVLGSLVRQLASLGVDKPILPPVVEHYKDAIAGFSGFDDQAWTTDECADVLLQLVAEYPAVILILDALDEMNQEDRQELLDVLSRILQESSTLIKVFISSRDNQDIALYLRGTPNVYIEADDNAEDISSFIENRLQAARLLHGKLPGDLRDEIVSTLLTHAQGMFRWVDLQIQSLRSLKVAADIKARLGVLPATLEGSYWEIYRDIQESGDHAFQLAMFAFQWLLYAQESISIDAFAVLASVHLHPDTSSAFTSIEVLDVCSNLIVTRQRSFTFAHLSVREFLEKLHSHHIDTLLPEHGNAAIGQACLHYLNLANVPGKGKELREQVFREAPGNSQILRSEETKKEEKRDKTEADHDDKNNDSRDANRTDGRDDDSKSLSDEDDSSYSDDDKDTNSFWEEHLKGFENGVDELFAILSSNAARTNEPTRYAMQYWAYHIDEAKQLRGTAAVNDLLKCFLVESSSRKAAKGFLAWCVGMTATTWYAEGRHSTGMNSSRIQKAAGLPPNPVWIVCFMEWLDMLQYLCSIGYEGIDKEFISDPSVLSSMPWLSHPPEEATPFWFAVTQKKAELIRILLEAGIQPELTLSTGGESALVRAARASDLEVMSVLLEHDNYGGEPAAALAFEVAAGIGDIAVLNLLLDRSKISIEAVGLRGLSAACAAGRIECLNFLLEKGAPVHDGTHLLQRAVLHNRPEILRILIKEGIGISGLSAALTTAISDGSDEVASILLDHGAQKDKIAVFRAIKNDTPQSAIRLIHAGFEIKGRDLGKRRTALHYAAEKGQSMVAAALLDRSAPVDVSDAMGDTPLHLAAARGHTACVRILLDHGADVLAEDRQGKLPLDLAEANGHAPTEEAIRERMARLLEELQLAKERRLGSSDKQQDMCGECSAQDEIHVNTT